MESLAPPIFVTLIVCLLLECLALALTNDVAIAAACRIIIFLLLGLSYTIKREINRRIMRHLQRLSITGLYQHVVLIVCLTTIIFHAFMLSFVASRLYSVILLFFSLLIAIDEYQELLWLQAYRHSNAKTRRPPHRIKEETGFVVVQNTEEEATIIVDERISFYYMLYTLVIHTPSDMLLLCMARPLQESPV